VVGLEQDNPNLVVPIRHRLQFRVLLLVLAMVVVTVGTSNWMLERLIEEKLDETLERETVRVGDHLAEVLRRALLSGNTSDLSARLDSAMADPGLGFIQIENRLGTVVAERVNNAEVHDHFAQHFGDSAERAALTQSRPTRLGYARAPEARVLRTPIFSSDQLSAAPDLLGHVSFVVIDPVHRATVQKMRALAMGVVCVACLISVPLTTLLMSRLMRPLRRIMRAITTLASGGEWPALPVKRSDELGLLARTFSETAEKLAAARTQLMLANASLEHQVGVRTAELNAANRRLELEIQTKNDFLRTVSHDLNAPLRNIAGMTTMLQRRFGEDLPEEVNHRLERIAANVKIESSMLDDLLELSRIRMRPGECEEVDLNELVRSIFEALEHEIIERRITCRVTTVLPHVEVERNLARQVFLNLVDNAAKYMGDRPTQTITISHCIAGDRVVISVADSGPGIAAADRERVFQVFRRGSEASTAGVPGRGIGLASVKAVVEHWGGEITLESEVGVGSTFAVSIPASRIVSVDLGSAAGRSAA